MITLVTGSEHSGKSAVGALLFRGLVFDGDRLPLLIDASNPSFITYVVGDWKPKHFSHPWECTYEQACEMAVSSKYSTVIWVAETDSLYPPSYDHLIHHKMNPDSTENVRDT